MCPACLLASRTDHTEVNVPHRTMTGIKSRLLDAFFWLRGPKTHEHIYYYLCKHVILLSNDPFTSSVMKQLALTQAKWTAESSHVYAARWKQMLRNPNTGVADPGFSRETEGTLNQRHSRQLIDSITKSWIPLVKHHYVRRTSNWAMTSWQRVNLKIDFFFLQ